MTDYNAMRIDDVTPYSGEHALPGIRFRAVGGAVGVKAWGMNVLQLEAGCDTYPDHDHAKDGQEELYVPLEGTGRLRVGGEDVALEPGVVVRVGPKEKRKLHPGPSGLTVLVIGGTPGKAYGS